MVATILYESASLSAGLIATAIGSVSAAAIVTIPTSNGQGIMLFKADGTG